MKEFDITAVGRGCVRLDLIDPEPTDHLADRFCRVIDLRTARILTILLIDAIKVAEIEEAKGNKRRRK